MPQLVIPITENDHIRGPVQAPITFLEYGDYQCHSCRLANPIIKQLQEQLGQQMRFIFRNFPLQTSHPYAFIAAEAAEAAGLQNKFWNMYDYLYENQSSISPESLVQFAEQLGLNLQKFKEDIQTEFIAKKIEDDFRSGVRSGVNGTPCFFLNGERYDGDRSYDSLLYALMQAQKI